MPTIFAEVDIDTTKFDRKVVSIRSGLNDIAKDAQKAGQSIDGAFSNKGAAASGLSAIREQTRLLLTDARGLSNLRIGFQGASQANTQLANLSSSAKAVTTATEPLRQIEFRAKDNGARQQLDALLKSSFKALEATEPLENIAIDAIDQGAAGLIEGVTREAEAAIASTGPLGAIAVNAVGAARAASDIESIADSADDAGSGVLRLSSSFSALATGARVAGTAVVGIGGAIAAATVGLAAAAVANGDLDFSLSKVAISAGELVTELGRLGKGIISYAADISDAIGLTGLLNTGLGFLSDGLDLATGAIGGFADRLLDVPPTAEEINRAVQESAERLADLKTEADNAGGAADLLARSIGATDDATRAYNGALQDHQKLLAEQARQAQLAAIANGDLADSVGLAVGAFQKIDLASATGEFDDYNDAIQNNEAFTRGQIEALADQELALERSAAAAVNTSSEVKALDKVFFDFEQQTAAINRQGRELAGTFQFLATTSRDAALAANQQEAALERLDGVFEDFAKETAAIDQSFRGLADSIGDFIGISGQQIEGFFTNANQLLTQLGVNFGVTFRSIAQSVADALGISTQSLDGFFGLAVEGLDILGIQFEDIFGKKLTGIIERFAGLSQNEIGVLGDIFGKVAGVITGIFNPAVNSSSNAFTALGFAGNESLGGISTQVEGLINDVFGLNDSIAGTTASVPVLGSSLAAVFTVGSIGFADLQQKLGSVQATLLGALNPAILTTNGLFKIFGIDAVGAVQSVIGSMGGLVNAVTNFGGIFSGVVGQASSIFKLFAGDIQGAFLQAMGPIGSALDAFGVNFSSVINGAGNVFRNVFQGIQSFGGQVFNALAGAGRTLLGALQGVAGGILGAFTGAFNAIRGVATGAFNAVLGAGRALAGGLGGIFNQIAGAASSAFNSIAGAAISTFNGIVAAAKGAAGVIGSTIGGAVGVAKSAIGGLGKAAKSVGKFLGIGGGGGLKFGDLIAGVRKAAGKKLAEGGVITGPTALAGPGVGGKKFASGGILDFPTALGTPANVTQTKNLGLAGEAGPEAILPLTQTSDGLGVTAKVAGGGGSTQIIIIRDAKSEDIDRIERRVNRLGASIESRSISAVERLLAA